MPLTILIIGAGLSGLTTSLALSLLSPSHKIRILEADPGLNEYGAGVQLSPNAVRVLDRLGVGEKAREVGVRLEGIRFMRYESGAVLAETRLGEGMEGEFGCPYLLVHRAELQRVLWEYARDRGVEISFSSLVTGVDADSTSVILANGTCLMADLIIGADGIRSTTRTSLFPSRPLSPTLSPSCAYRTTLPLSLIASNPLTAPLLSSAKSYAWLGPHRQLLAYCIPHGSTQLFNLVGIHLGKVKDAKSFHEVAAVEDFRAAFKDFCPVVKELLNMIPSGGDSGAKVLRWQLAHAPSVPTWHSSNVLLIGDAAHAMVPFLAQGACMAIEDAAVLSRCLAGLEGSGDVTEALERFQERRMERVQDVQRASGYMERMLHLEDGREQRGRDEAMGRDGGGEEVGNPNLWADEGFRRWLFGWDGFADGGGEGWEGRFRGEE